MEANHNDPAPAKHPERHSKNIPATLVLLSAFFPASAAEFRTDSLESADDGRAVATARMDLPPQGGMVRQLEATPPVLPNFPAPEHQGGFAGLTVLNQNHVIFAAGEDGEPQVAAPVAAAQAKPEVPAPAPQPAVENREKSAPPAPTENAAKGAQQPPAGGQGEKPKIDVGAELKDFGDTLYDWLSRGLIAGLGIAGAISALRGTMKVVEHFKERWDARSQFDRGQWFDRLTCNMVAISDEGGVKKLDVLTFASPQLSDFITNKYAQEIFISAAKQCDDDQPFPTLNFSRDRHGRLDGLNRMNKYFRESFSSIYQDDIVAAGMGLPTMRGTFYLLPTCELVHKGAKPGRCIGVIALSESTFNSLGDSQEVEKLIADNPSMKDRIEKMRDAYIEHMAYAKKYGPDGELFPKVTVVIQK
jgi:hypothetical protein